jgi:ribosomal protein S18 acetylase RimI-like enzyme
MITFAPLAAADAAALADVNRLLPQLRTERFERAASLADLQAIVASPTTRMIVGRDSTGIVAMAMLHVVPTVGKRLGHVDCVVVDEAYRRRGVARSLMEHVAETARGLGAEQLKLTSRRTRVAANLLYPSLGFDRVDSNVYTLRLTEAAS